MSNRINNNKNNNNNRNRDLSNNKFFFYDRIKNIKKNPLLLSNYPYNNYNHYNKKNTLKPLNYNKYKMNVKNHYPYNIKNALDTLTEKNTIYNNNNNNKNLFGLLNEIDYKYDNIYFNKDHNPFFTASHKNIPQKISLKKKPIDINVEINNLKDLIDLCEKYPISYDVVYNINMEAIHNIKTPVINLNNMIGMNKLKENVINQILYFIQSFHQGCSKDFMHTVIYGPPGTGKTEIAKILGDIFSKLGVLKNKKFKKVTRSDLIAGYLGQTAIKTRDVINSALGGVLFIDEAYALGNSEKRDSFAKECIDTLCEALSDNKDNLMVIIAGYENELKKCFFEYNQGLDSRFTWRFKTDDYTAAELNLIFQKKVKEINWSLKKPIKDSWFENNKKYFSFYGRDIETLLAKTKIAHSKRVFCLGVKHKKIIILKDLNKGFEMFLDNDEVKNRNNDNIYNNMYC